MLARAVVLDPLDLVAPDQLAARPPSLEVTAGKAAEAIGGPASSRSAGRKDPHLVADHHRMRVCPLELRVPGHDRSGRGERQRGGDTGKRPHPHPLLETGALMSGPWFGADIT
ncbi:hypothetical protein P0F65_22180 [Sphingomonas sp. I4]